MKPVMERVPVDPLERLWREEAPQLWRALLAYSSSADVASDALSEAFAQAAARGSQIRMPDRWVWTVAFRIAAGELKDRAKSASFVERSDQLDASDDALELIEALRRLPPKQRAALLLYYYGGYRTREIGSMLGTSSATVRVHLSAGRRRLRVLLEVKDV
jgi:RNA polymerase sigma factor (sigma-70 family)